MLENIGVYLQYAVTLVGILTSVFFFKRARKAEIRIKEYEANSKEIGTADEMIELVKKAHGEVVLMKQEISDENKRIADENKKENEKLCRYIARLEKALKSINNCPHRAECPIPDVLQSDQEADHVFRKHKD